MRVYCVRLGEMLADHVVYENVVCFTTQREAQTVVAEAKREDAYEHQYDDVEVLHVYRTRKQRQNGVQQ